MASIVLPDEIIAQSLCSMDLKEDSQNKTTTTIDSDSSEYSDVEETTMDAAVSTIKKWSKNATKATKATPKSNKSTKSTTKSTTKPIKTTTTTTTTPLESRSAYQFISGTHIILESSPSKFATGTSTGWMTWNASVVLCDYLEHHCTHLIKNHNVADISSGNGLVACCLALLNATTVLATETEDCTTLTEQNAILNQIQDRMFVKSYLWGAASNPVLETKDVTYTVVTMCDLLYIALRDGLEVELTQTIVEICEGNNKKDNSKGVSEKEIALYFAFEQRLGNEEDVFMLNLSQTHGLMVAQISKELINVNRLAPEDDGGTALMMWEDPPIKIYKISSK